MHDDMRMVIAGGLCLLLFLIVFALGQFQEIARALGGGSYRNQKRGRSPASSPPIFYGWKPSTAKIAITRKKISAPRMTKCSSIGSLRITIPAGGV